MSVKKCSKCQSIFECGNNSSGCWCEEVFIGLETLKALKATYDNCLCPKCLKEYQKD
ncbi:MAG: cysteine-rich CWC family protein [Bacteroidetes bacterium]|nr:cysteine-rich CWC family protein [Bacteroidota bacterium]